MQRNLVTSARQRWQLVAVMAVAGLAVGVALSFLLPASYTAQLSLYVSAQAGAGATEAYQGSELSQNRVVSYVELATGPRVLGAAARELGRGESVTSLGKKVSASSKENSVLIDVYATDGSPQDAANVANAIGQVLPGVVAGLEAPASASQRVPVIVRVVEAAALPDRPSSVSPLIIVLFSLLLFTLLGVAAAAVLDRLDRTLKTAASVTEATGLSVVGEIPKGTGTDLHPTNARSSLAESVRKVRTNLQFVNVDTPTSVVALSSAVPGEGKSSLTASLAVAFAAAGARALVIEADLRRPAIAEHLDVDREVGLTNVLASRIQLTAAIRRSSRSSLDFLASGPLPPNPSELLASRQMQAVIAECRQRYDFVLIDTPPVLPVSDTLALAPHVDGVILVCRYGKTTHEQARRAADALRTANATLLGAIHTFVQGKATHGYVDYESYQRPHAVPSYDEEPATTTTIDPRHAVSARADRPVAQHRSSDTR